MQVSVTAEEMAVVDALMAAMMATPEYGNAYAPLSRGSLDAARYMACMLGRSGFAVDEMRIADRMGVAIRFGGTHEIIQYGMSMSGLPFKAFDWAFPDSFDKLCVGATPAEIAAWLSKHARH